MCWSAQPVVLGLALWLTLKLTVLLRQGYVTELDFRMLHGPGWMVMAVVWNLVWFAVTKALGIIVLFLLARRSLIATGWQSSSSL